MRGSAAPAHAQVDLAAAPRPASEANASGLALCHRRPAARDQRGSGEHPPPGPKPHSWVTHPLDLDIGEVADGYHLIARSISLSAEHLLFEFAFAPERTGEAEVWLNMSYTADIPVSQDYIGAGNDVQYARPPLKARYAWFDFFRPDYEWIDHFYPSGQPDSDYLRNRIARLTFDLRTGEAQIGT